MITARELPFGSEGKSFVVEFEPATERREANVFTVILKQVATRRLADLASFFSGVSIVWITERIFRRLGGRLEHLVVFCDDVFHCSRLSACATTDREDRFAIRAYAR